MAFSSIPSLFIALLLLDCNYRISSFTLVTNHHNRRIINLVGSSNSNSNVISASSLSSDSITNEEVATSDNQENNEHYYTSTFPGTLCKIQIDTNNMSLSRKAWKKRRRSKSPILVPVSIMNILQKDNDNNDETDANNKTKEIVQWNIMYIVMKYGDGDARGISIRTNRMIQLYERIFLSNTISSKMIDFCMNEMGYDGIKDMLHDLFDDNTNANNSGIKLSSTSSNGLLLYIDSMSRLRGRDVSSHTALIQTNLNGYHTGQVLLLGKEKQQQALPLGAALRIRNTDAFMELLPQEQQDDDSDANSIKTLEAYVQRFDPNGDDGNPLLTLSLTPITDNTNMISTTTTESSMTHRKRDRRTVRRPLDILSSIPKYSFEDLKDVDNGTPQLYNATIVRISRRSRSAFVDIGVGRRTSPKSALTAGAYIRVLGMLRFQDILPSSSDLCYQCVPTTNNYDSNDDCDDDVDHQTLKPIPLIIGQTIPVYISRIFSQSSRFMVSLTSPTVKPKEMKQQKLANKRLSKLSPFLPIIEQYIDTTCHAIIKAKSKVGHGYYVQPLIDDLKSFVGFASYQNDHDIEEDGDVDECNENDDYKPGDEVSIRIQGVDPLKGQLSFTLLGKED